MASGLPALPVPPEEEGMRKAVSLKGRADGAVRPDRPGDGNRLSAPGRRFQSLHLQSALHQPKHPEKHTLNIYKKLEVKSWRELFALLK